MDSEHNIVEFCIHNTRGRVGRAVFECTGSYTTATMS